MLKLTLEYKDWHEQSFFTQNLLQKIAEKFTQRCSVKVFLKLSQNSNEKNSVLESLLNKVVAIATGTSVSC